MRHADDSQPVANDYGVITAVSDGGSLPSEFFEQFASTLAGHRVWDRDTSHIPA